MVSITVISNQNVFYALSILAYNWIREWRMKTENLSQRVDSVPSLNLVKCYNVKKHCCYV